MKIKLFYKIFITFLVIALLPVLVGGKLFTATLEDHLRQSINKEAQGNLYKNAAVISDTVENLDKILETTAKYLVLSPADKATLRWIYKLHPEIVELVEIDINSIILNAFSRYEFLPTGSKLENCHPTKLDHTTIQFGNWDNEPHICFKNPITSLTTGENIGAIFAKANINNLLQKIFMSQGGDHIQYLINAADNKVIFHPDLNLVLSKQTADTLPLIKDLRTGRKLSRATYTNFSGIEVVGSAIPISGTSLYLVDEIPQQKAFALLSTYKQLISNVVWLSVLFIFFTAYLASRTITKPVGQLLEATKKIGDGNLETPIPDPHTVFTDEITDFSHHFKSMVEALKKDRQQRDEAIKVKQQTQEKLHRAQKMETIGLLAGGAAHDLNNILSGIIGYPELMLRKLPEDSPLRPSLEAIQQSGMNASAIVADMLMVSRGVATPHQPCNLNQIISEYFDSPEWKSLYKQKPHILLNIELCETLQNTRGSVVHIKKALMNLVTNGLESLQDDGTITIKTENCSVDATLAEKIQASPGEFVVLQVIDNGTGIPEEALNHIFEPFFTKKEMGRSGTGLGLTIVANTVQDHNGGITVESSPEGTVFKLFFPATTEKNNALKNEKKTIEIKGNGEHILVVDDVPQQRDLAQQILTELGYHVETVASGEQAIELLSKHPVDLVLLDMIMNPGIGGYETYKQIVAHNPRQKAVIASGFAENSDVKKTLKLGAGAFIKKPYSMATIAEAVASVLRDK